MRKNSDVFWLLGVLATLLTPYTFAIMTYGGLV